MNRRQLLKAVIPLAFLTGCIAYGPKFTYVHPTDSGSVVLYIYRDAELADSAISPDVFVDGRPLGLLLNGGYFALQLKEGVHSVRLELPGWIGKAAVEAPTHGGQTFFVRAKTTYEGGNRTFALNVVSNEVGLAEIEYAKNIATIGFSK